MSTHSDPEDFEQLRKLLALKRSEVPPPGYFETLPRKVMTRVEMTELGIYSTWWEWVVARFDAKPVLACAYGFAVSGLLLLGFRLSQQFEREVSTGPVQDGGWLAATPDPLTMPSTVLPSNFGFPVGLTTTVAVDDSAELPAAHSSLFRVKRASFAMPGH
jgi:hypothetical protein